MINLFYIDEIIKTAIKEDINYIDVSTDYLIPSDQISKGEFVSKDEGVLCGLEIAMRVFKLMDESFTFEKYKEDGDWMSRGDIIVSFSGHTAALLKSERVALNLIQHLSGVATAANQCVRLIEGTNACVAETRKTIPGMRALQKYAVTVGGGKNHRFNLSDCAMLKDNHIDAGGGITLAVKKLREKIGHTVKIEVETRNLCEVQEAISAGADIIMLDNMSNDEMKEAVQIIGKKALTEASGNVTAETIRYIAETGVDIISIGAITHSVKAFDISMKII